MPTHHPSWPATSKAARHGGTHPDNGLLRASGTPHAVIIVIVVLIIIVVIVIIVIILRPSNLDPAQFKTVIEAEYIGCRDPTLGFRVCLGYITPI